MRIRGSKAYTPIVFYTVKNIDDKGETATKKDKIPTPRMDRPSREDQDPSHVKAITLILVMRL